MQIRKRAKKISRLQARANRVARIRQSERWLHAELAVLQQSGIADRLREIFRSAVELDGTVIAGSTY